MAYSIQGIDREIIKYPQTSFCRMYHIDSLVLFSYFNPSGEKRRHGGKTLTI
jgi:hypothetical protein